MQITTKYGVMNSNNELIIPTIYRKIIRTSNENFFIIISNDNNYGLIDKNNNIVLEPIYYYITNVSESVSDKIVFVEKDDKNAIFDLNKKEFITNFIYDSITELNKKYIYLKNNNLCSLFDIENNKILNLNFSSISPINKNNNIVVITKNDNYLYLYNIEENKILSKPYISISDGNFYNTFVCSSKKHDCVVINDKGEEISEHYIKIWNTDYYHYPVKIQDNQENFIKQDGSFLLKDNYYYVSSFSYNGYAIIQNEQDFVGLIDLNGNFIFDIKYDGILEFKYKYDVCFIVTLYDKIGLFYKDGAELIPFGYYNKNIFESKENEDEIINLINNHKRKLKLLNLNK